MNAAALMARLQSGDKLHMMIVDGRRVWWLEAPHANVADTVVSSAFAQSDAAGIREAGDSLFGLPMNSQTWEG